MVLSKRTRWCWGWGASPNLPGQVRPARLPPLRVTPVHILIGAQVANEIRHLLKDYTKTIPTVLEIPSKDLP